MNQSENHYNNLLDLYGSYATYFSILPILFGFLYWKNLNKPLLIFLYYLLLRLFLNLATIFFIYSVNIVKHYRNFWKPILDYFQITDTNFFAGIFYLVDFVFIGYFFIQIIESVKINFILKATSKFLIVFQIINYLFIDGIHSEGFFGPLLDGILLSLIPAYYLWEVSNNPPNFNIAFHSYFWISVFIFIPHLVSFLYIFTADQLANSNFVLFCKAHIGRNILEILAQIGFLYAFSKAKYVKYI